MTLEEYITKCVVAAKNKERLPKQKPNFSFLFEDPELNNCHKTYLFGSFQLTYATKEFTFNHQHKLKIQMVVCIYPQAPFYKIYYIYEIVFMNCQIGKITLEELEITTWSKENLFNLYKNEREKLVTILNKHGYDQLANIDTSYRIPLVEMKDNVAPTYILGCQPDLDQLLGFGIIYVPRKKKRLETFMHYSLDLITDEVLTLAKHTKLKNYCCVVDKALPKLDHTSAIAILDSLCTQGGGERINTITNAYAWKLGTEELNEGNLNIVATVYAYLSPYIKTFWVKAELAIQLQCENLPKFTIEHITTIIDPLIRFPKALPLFYDCVLKLEELDYLQQRDLRFKLPIQVANSSISKELEIGEILFGLKPKEYSYIAKVKKTN